MSKDYKKGRADAAKGQFKPPTYGLFASSKKVEETLKRKEEYREGYYDKRREMGKDDSGGCFLTTACVESLGLPDNCHELTVLRSFRDGYMASFPMGRAAVMAYYKLAPGMVAAIQQQPNADSELRRIYNQLICPAVELIEAGRNQEAFTLYRKGVLHLAERHGFRKGSSNPAGHLLCPRTSNHGRKL